MTCHLWSSFLICVSSRQKYHVNVWHIIYDHRSSCFRLTEIKTVSLMFNGWSMIIVLYFVFYRDKYRVFNVQHTIYDIRYSSVSLPDKNTMSMFDIIIIYNHRSSCFCLTEIKTVSLMFDRDLWSSLFILRFTDMNTVSLMFGRWSTVSILLMCLFQTSHSILIMWHIIYDLPSICLFLPELNSVLIARHFICEHRCFCLCQPEINTVPLTFDISSIIIVVYIRVLQR